MTKAKLSLTDKEYLLARDADRMTQFVADDGRMTLRNLMVPRAVTPETRALVLDADGGAALHDRDRSFVYRSFQSYRRTPRAQS